MRNYLKLFAIPLAMALMGVIFTQCSDETSTPAAKINGTVSVNGGTIADGAIVILSSEPLAASIVARTVADENGKFEFMGVESGTYYLSARWEPGNNNNLKSAGSVMLKSADVEVAVDGDQTADINLTGMASDGDGMVSLTGGWKWDNTHSTIGFDFPYDEFNAVFKGHFGRVGFDELEFDEQNPENTKIKAWVDITSIETGSPSPPCAHGRDGITGCIGGTFAVDIDPADTVTAYCQDGTMVTNWPNESMESFDLWGDGSETSYMKQSSIVGMTGVATFEATEVTAFGTGYHAKGDFSFMGTTKSVDMYFSYIEGYEGEDRSGNATMYSSFYGTFKFAAKADFGVVSGHVGSADVNVSLAVQFNKAL